MDPIVDPIVKGGLCAYISICWQCSSLPEVQRMWKAPHSQLWGTGKITLYKHVHEFWPSYGEQ
jgi:hypothetical protein